jgi:hypothetical protein
MSKQKRTTGTSSKSSGASPAITSDLIEELVTEVMELMDKFMAVEQIDSTMSGTQRRRLFSAGVKNYGFIDKAWDIAHDNPNFMPPNFYTALMGKNLRDIEDLRQLVVVLEQFLQVVNDLLLIKGDTAYRFALRVYDSLKEQKKNKVPGAAPLFDELVAFFRKRKRITEGEPTVKELEHDFKRLIKGEADGKIEIINERPQIKAGVCKVVDDVHKGRAVAKETAEVEIDESKRK